jgi:hypothetical protein
VTSFTLAKLKLKSIVRAGKTETQERVLMAKKESGKKLRYNKNEMHWQDENGKKTVHPRYSQKPASLDGKAFMKSYLSAVKSGQSLNEFMKINQAFSVADVKKQASQLKKAYEAFTASQGKKETFKLLRKKKHQEAGNKLGQSVADVLAELNGK